MFIENYTQDMQHTSRWTSFFFMPSSPVRTSSFARGAAKTGNTMGERVMFSARNGGGGGTMSSSVASSVPSSLNTSIVVGPETDENINMSSGNNLNGVLPTTATSTLQTLSAMYEDQEGWQEADLLVSNLSAVV